MTTKMLMDFMAAMIASKNGRHRWYAFCKAVC